jgi:hypothetical protein
MAKSYVGEHDLACLGKILVHCVRGREISI